MTARFLAPSSSRSLSPAAALAVPAAARWPARARFSSPRSSRTEGSPRRGAPSDASLTAWATFGLVASGGSAARSARALAYLAQHEDARQERHGHRPARARPARAGRPSRRVARPPARRQARARSSTREIWAILALRRAGEPAPPALARDVLAAQSRSGGWSWLRGRQAGLERHGGRARGAAVGGRRRNADHPWARRARDVPQPRRRVRARRDGRDSDAQSTAWAIQALFACGKRPGGATWRFLAGCAARTAATATPSSMRRRPCG